MKRTALAAAVLAAIATSSAAHAEEAASAPSGGIFALENFTGSMALTSDYRNRGISNSDGPAIQGGITWSYNGMFVGVWGSNTEFSDSNIELDYNIGYGWQMYGLNFVVQGIYYHFPGEQSDRSQGLDPPGFDPTLSGGNSTTFPQPLPGLFSNGGQPGLDQPYDTEIADINADYVEFNVGITKTFEMPLSPTLGFNYHFSPDFFGDDGDSHHFGGSLAITLPNGLSPYVKGGHQEVEGDEFSAYFGTPKGYNWEYFQVGAAYAVLGFTLDLSWVWVTPGGSCGAPTTELCEFNGGFKTFYNDYNYSTDGDTSYKDLTNSTFVFTVSRTF
ncbi:MAG: TorF family putative porin [Gammaproteobacteria bacterium]